MAFLLFGSVSLHAADPAWWRQGSPPVIDSQAVANNQGAANIGQAKWMAKSALNTITALDPALGAAIAADLVGTGKPLANWDGPQNQAEGDRQHFPLQAGQLKAIAAPFYQHINAVAPQWLAAERSVNHTEKGGIFPWTDSVADDRNNAVATVGQLKAVFALHLTEDSDGDGISDFYEWAHFGGLDGTQDSDGDGLTDAEEYIHHTDPHSAVDNNTNGIPDDWETVHAGQFTVWPPVLAKTVAPGQTGSGSFKFFNDTGAAVTWTAAVSNNITPGYSWKNSISDPQPDGGYLVWDNNPGSNVHPVVGVSQVTSGWGNAPTPPNFSFYGKTYGGVHVSSKGVLVFDNSVIFTPPDIGPVAVIPGTGAPLNAIAPLWNIGLNPNANPTFGPNVLYGSSSSTSATAGNQLHIHFYSIRTGGPVYDFTTTLVADGRIIIRYYSETTTGNFANTSVGIQGPTVGRGLTIAEPANPATSTALGAGKVIEINPNTQFLTLPVLTGSVPAHSTGSASGNFVTFELADSQHDADVSFTYTGGASSLAVKARLIVPNSAGTVVLTGPPASPPPLQSAGIPLVAKALDHDGVAKVEFYDGLTKLGEVLPSATTATGNFTYNWTDSSPGSHSITAKAIDPAGMITNSAAITVVVAADSDGDGWEDGWETTTYGSLNESPTSDFDKDGLNNTVDPDPTHSAVLADPDGSGVPSIITSATTTHTVVGWWDFQTSPSVSGLTSTYTARNASSVTLLTGSMSNVAGSFSDKGLVSHDPLSADKGGYVDLRVFGANSPTLKNDTDGFTVNYWVKFAENELNGGPITGQAHEYQFNNSSGTTQVTAVPAAQRVVTLLSYSSDSTSNPTVEWRATRAATGGGTKFELRQYNAGFTYTTLSNTNWTTNAKLDDGRWHHVALHADQPKMWLDGVQIGSTMTQGLTIPSTGTWYMLAGGTKRVNPAFTGSSPAVPYADFRGELDCLMVHRGILSTAEVMSLYHRDRDLDGLYDITEVSTAIWHDLNGDDVKTSDEIFYVSSPTEWQPPDTDSDGDGKTDIQEQLAGTLLGDPDQDHDLIPDGWELDHGLDPTVPNNGDTDHDGLSDLDEYRYNSNPLIPDSDGDGVSDFVEFTQGSNPGDASDHGQPLPPGESLPIKLGVGDRSGSKSEDYVLNVFAINEQTGAEERFYTLRSGGFGQYDEKTLPIFHKGKTYTFQIQWMGTNGNVKNASGSSPLEGPDFDYHMVVEPQGTGYGNLIDSYNPATGSITDGAILDPQDVNPSDDDDDDVQNFLSTIQKRRVALVNLKVNWETVYQDADLEDHVDPWTGNVNGKAWHPDSPLPNQSDNFRDLVGLKISGGLPKATVWGRSFDVDDTTSENFDNAYGEHPVVIDTNGSSGGDNRMDAASSFHDVPIYGRFEGKGAELFGRFSTVFDSSGISRAQLRIGISPGNNYRVAATMMGKAELDSLYVTIGSGAADKLVSPISSEKPNFQGGISPLLTIWRKLWLEVDSMSSQATPPAGEEDWVHGMVTAISPGTPLPNGTPIWDCNFSANTSRDVAEFENGWFFNRRTNAPYRISGVTKINSGTFVVHCLGNPGTVEAYTLQDDDNTALPPAYSPILPRNDVDWSYCAGKFKPAFITLVSAGSYNLRKEIPFKLNEAEASLAFLPVIWNDAIDLTDSRASWVAHAVFGFQASASRDGDPDSESDLSGATPFSFTSLSTEYSVFWLEQIREKFNYYWKSTSPIDLVQGPILLHREINLTVMHEIGHQPETAYGAATGADHKEQGIMSAGGSEGTDTDYTSPTVARFRRSLQWSTGRDQ